MEMLINSSPLSSSIPLTHDSNHFQESKSSIIEKLESCKSLKELKQIHSYIIKTSPSSSHQTQQFLYTRIISISATASTPISDVTYIHSLFSKLENPTIDLYNAVIRSFNSGNDNHPLMGLFFYEDLLAKGLVADRFTYPYVLKACALLRDLNIGEQVHSHVVKTGFVLDLYVVNVLVRFYGKCGVLERARKVFDESPERDLVTWTTLIQGYVKTGFYEKGVEVFYEMCEAGVRADEMTMTVLISAAARLQDLSLGKKLHEYICDYKLNFDVYIGNALVDMYLKCGDAGLALEIFNEMPVKNVVSWNSMISGLVHQEKFKLALNLFKKMRKQGVKPDEFTLVGVLNCCSNLGALKESKWVHSYMDLYKKVATILSKCGWFTKSSHKKSTTGLLTEAEHFIQEKIVEPDGLVWGALLAACRVHGNVEIGERAKEKVDMMDEEKDGAYVLMANLFSSFYRFRDAVKLRKTMKQRKMKKVVGYSSIEVDGVAYEFRKGEKSNIKGEEIYMLLDVMRKHLKNGGELIYRNVFKLSPFII
ncbi:hypothetical protein OSB04_029138, partial [Centaurea solstitialis]